MPAARCFTSSPPAASRDPSPESKIRDWLRRIKHDKWGWVIYRCTYGDDAAWARFKRIIEQRSRREIAESDTPEVADSLEWTFVEDASTLDGASRDQLRARFRAWVPGAARTEQPRSEDRFVKRNPRYGLFIQVDEDVLRSVVPAPGQPPLEDDWWDEGWVNLVDADWRPLSELFPDEVVDDGDVYEPIDGCTEENVGWVRIVPSMVSSRFYVESPDGFTGDWYPVFKRPPEVICD